MCFQLFSKQRIRLTSNAGHGSTHQPSLSSCGHHWPARPRRPLRSGWTRRRNHSASGLRVDGEARLGNHNAHVANAGASKATTSPASASATTPNDVTARNPWPKTRKERKARQEIKGRRRIPASAPRSTRRIHGRTWSPSPTAATTRNGRTSSTTPRRRARRNGSNGTTQRTTSREASKKEEKRASDEFPHMGGRRPEQKSVFKIRKKT